MKKAHWLMAAIALGSVPVGCTNTTDEEAKPAVTFEGTKDPRFVGKWKVTKGETTYHFKEDGTYAFAGKIKNRGSTMDLNSSGNWLVKDDRFLMKDDRGSVVPYTYKLEGNKLTLGLTGTMKSETAMVRQK